MKTITIDGTELLNCEGEAVNTREILEKCAMACGYSMHGMINDSFIVNFPTGMRGEWNPLTRNDDCAEMCAQLMIDTHWGSNTTFVEASGYDSSDTLVYYQAELKDHNNDKCAAWRHAACHVAAMMGERV